jgi:hypothetical protein
LFVVREDDLAALEQHYDDAVAGRRPVVLLEGPLGSEARAAVGSRRAVADWTTCSSGASRTRRGRLGHASAGTARSSLHRSPTFRGKVEMALSTSGARGRGSDFIDTRGP